MNPLDLPAGALCALIGPPGCGKTTFAAQWPDSWRISLDAYRKAASDTEKDLTATAVAVQVQGLFLDARMARGRTDS